MNAMYVQRKQKMEIFFGVHIDEAAMYFAEEVVQVYGEEPAQNGTAAMNLVERACRVLRKSLDSDSEEINLDWDEYCQGRALVEVMELRREKSIACRSVTLPRVEKELAECTSKLEAFKSKWAPVVAQLRLVSGKRAVLLRCMRDELVYFTKQIKMGFLQLDYVSQLHSLLSTSTSQLQHTVHGAFRERLVVGPHDIAKVASSMTGFPLKYFYRPFKLRLMMPKIDDLKSRLSGKLIELDDVIHKIVHALSKQKSIKGPLGSFLLLGPHGCGRTKLAQSLAGEIYGDKDRVIKLDLYQYTKPDYISSLLHVLDRDKKQGTVVMFENIENAHAWSGVLSEITRNGRLSNGRRMSVDFSDDLVLVSSHIGHEAFCYCRCLRDTIPKILFREILKDPALIHAEIGDKTCYLHDFYTKVANQFKPEFMDLFNDVVVFPWLTPQNHMAISRLQMRDVATTMSTSLKKKVILYPSDAALQNMVCYQDTSKKGAHAYETWHKVYMDPVLNDDALENDADDMIIIYIDALVGLRDGFSFRVENSRYLQKDQILKSSKQNLRKLRSRYRQEKMQVNLLYSLQTSCHHLIELIHAKVPIDAGRVLMESENAVRLINELLKNEPSDINELVHFDVVNGEIQSSPRDRKMKRAKVCLKRVARQLKRSLKERVKATQAITEALVRRLRASYNDLSNKSSNLPASFLCLGLTPESKKQFAKSLEEHLVTDDGKILFQVDLSLCTEPDSFFRSAYTMDTHQLLIKAVERRPHCVIVFHRLEMAHISVFSTILSILDDGGSKDNEGNVTNFGNSVIVIVSDLGNKEMIGGLNGHRPETKCPNNPIEFESTSTGGLAVGSSLTDEMGCRGLRYELLYRLDQLLLFDPFSDDQLNQFAKSPMKSLEEKSHSLYSAFARLFDVQGKKKQYDDPDENIKYIEEALGNVVKISGRDEKDQGEQASNDPSNL